MGGVKYGRIEAGKLLESVVSTLLLPIARNSEPDRADARDSLSIKNFVFLAFDWSVNFKNVIWRARVRMQYGDSRSSR